MVRPPSPRTIRLVAIAACLLALPCPAFAQPVSGDNALPGARRMVLLNRPASVATVAVSGQYGFTSSVLRDRDRHHRLAGRVALALTPANALSLGFSMNGRWDTHSGGSGSDQSIVGDPTVFALLRLAHAGVFRLGLGVELWAPGGDDPGIVVAALSPTATLHTQLDLGGLTLALRVGYLLDRSANSIPENRAYTPGDQVSLGVTAADAVLVGLGATGRVGVLDLYADVSLDALVRRGDLPFSASRATATLGGMVTLGERYHLGLEATVHLNGYPPIRADAPYRVDPRVAVGLTFAADLGTLRSGEVDGEATDTDDATDANLPEELTATAPDGSEEPDVTEPPMVLPDGEIRGSVRGPRNTPIAASIVLQSTGQAFTADDEGLFSITVTPGEHDLHIEAPGYRAQDRHVTVEETGVVVIEVHLRPE